MTKIKNLEMAATISNNNDICQSDDRQFLAVNLLRFSNFRYDPVGEVKVFRGHDAEVVSRLFVGQ